MISSDINVVLAWTLCSLVASFGCRCGTLHDSPSADATPTSRPTDPYNPFDPSTSPVRRERLDAIKTDILGKLGLEDSGQMLPQPAANVTSEERRRALRLYRQSVDQLRGKSHRIPGEDKQLGRAKRFFSFAALQTGMFLLGCIE